MTEKAIKPLISILIPVYNREDLLKPSIESALGQTAQDLEVVVVDNASTDGTWDVCRHYAAADSRVRIFRNSENVGPVRNWARCIQEARGTYGKFLYSDDTIADQFLAQTAPWLDDPSVGFTLTAARVGPSEEDFTVSYSWPGGTGLYPSSRFVKDALFARPWAPVSPGCALFRIESLRRHLQYELPLSPPFDLASHGAGSDLLLYLYAARRYPRFAAVKEPLAFFRSHPDSTTIEGRGGEIELSYALTRYWFASRYVSSHLGRRALALHWLQEIRSQRQLVNPVTAAARYRGTIHPVVLAGEGITLLGEKVLQRMRSGVRAFIRAFQERVDVSPSTSAWRSP